MHCWCEARTSNDVSSMTDHPPKYSQPGPSHFGRANVFTSGFRDARPLPAYQVQHQPYLIQHQAQPQYHVPQQQQQQQQKQQNSQSRPSGKVTHNSKHAQSSGHQQLANMPAATSVTKLQARMTRSSNEIVENRKPAATKPQTRDRPVQQQQPPDIHNNNRFARRPTAEGNYVSVEVAEQMLKNMEERAEECEGEGEGEERVLDGMQQRQAHPSVQQRHALTAWFERCQQIQTATARTEHLGMMEERSLVAANSHDVEVVTSVDASLVLSVEGTVELAGEMERGAADEWARVVERLKVLRLKEEIREVEEEIRMKEQGRWVIHTHTQNAQAQAQAQAQVQEATESDKAAQKEEQIVDFFFADGFVEAEPQLQPVFRLSPSFSLFSG